MMKRARLRASSSERWIACGGSRKAEENLPDIQNKYSTEGTLAHEIAAMLLKKQDITNYNITPEMLEYIQLYVEYVNDISPTTIYYPEIYVEKEVNFSHIVPNETGTADCIVISLNSLHIIDFKYGLGHTVNAYKNTQLLLYAMGMYNELRNKDNITEIVLHIVQPRKNNFDKWTLSVKDLSFWEGYIKAKAEIALRDDAIRIPSEVACRWCKARTSCPAIYNFTNDVVESHNQNVDDDKIKVILDNSKLIKNYLNSLEKKVFEELTMGKKFPGYKLVEGRNLRKIKTESENKLFELLGEKAYIKSIVKVTDLEKIIGKEEIKSFVHVFKSKPLLVRESDKRKALTVPEYDFMPIE